MTTLRVRSILNSLNPNQRAELKKLLPSTIGVPQLTTHKYPSMLLSCLPKGEEYSLLGFIAEHMLHLPATEISQDSLIAKTREMYPALTEDQEAKIRASKTTDPFLVCLLKTRKALQKVIRSDDDCGPLKLEEEVVFGSVAGHPDMWNKRQVFEVKLTGLLEDNWMSFLYQVFAYGAIMPDVKELYLVLPLQQGLWKVNIEGWAQRQAYRDFLVKVSTHSQTDGFTNMVNAKVLCDHFCIGCHISKQKTLLDTVKTVAGSDKPYQMFLGGPQNSHLKKDLATSVDAAETKKLIQATGAQIYIHSQYIINLCAKCEDGWNVKLLKDNLEVAKAMGAKGVVVHVGKSTTQSLSQAMETMRSSILECLPSASVACPLLLETPAGQGTETLTNMTEFLTFVDSFKDERFRMCLDTCHVFACRDPTSLEKKENGHDPIVYIQAALTYPGLLKLVHFNDSLEACGSCKDRHAFVGTGKIGFETMAAIAKLCSEHGVPMVIE
jgi:deoxyribonuclease IV